MIIELNESDRQAVILALANLAVERPGWNYMLTRIALKMDNDRGGKPQMYEEFKKTHAANKLIK